MTGSDWAVVPAVGGGTARTTVGVVVVVDVVKLLPTRSPRIINTQNSFLKFFCISWTLASFVNDCIYNVIVVVIHHKISVQQFLQDFF